jgi:mRNA interferase MazF
MHKGTIVLTKFPFTDLSSSKRRPAVIISKVTDNEPDVIVSFISSVIPETPKETEYILEASHKDFAQTGLKKASVFKMDKLATLEKIIFTGELGTISDDIYLELKIRLTKALDIEMD